MREVKPKVSVVIPCRNEIGQIADFLASVMRQVEPGGGFEVIIADGMSDDGTREILTHLQEQRSFAIPLRPAFSSAFSDIVSQPSTLNPKPSSVAPLARGSVSDATPSPGGEGQGKGDLPRFALAAFPLASSSSLRVIDNPGRIVSKGLNVAIRAARGDIIVRMDAHTEYAPDYVIRCVEALEKTGADNVGGPWVAKGDGFISRAVAAAFQSPFAVGGARGHDPNHEGPVDTVYLGCWRKSAFEKFGYFDEELVRNQDDEHNLRIIRGGGKVYQSPKIRSWYRPRGSLGALFKQYMQYGYWKVRVIQKHKLPASWRHLVPGAFVFTLMLLFLLSLAREMASPISLGSFPWPVKSFAYFTGHLSSVLLGLTLASYLFAVFVASVHTAARTEWKLLSVLPLVFPCYHFGYGWGFLRGVWDFVIRRKGPRKTFGTLTR